MLSNTLPDNMSFCILILTLMSKNVNATLIEALTCVHIVLTEIGYMYVYIMLKYILSDKSKHFCVLILLYVCIFICI